MPKPADVAAYEVISFRATPEQAKRWRDACYWARLKFVDFARQALDAEAERLQKKHNDGKPFRARPER
jgi:hypothetical protein